MTSLHILRPASINPSQIAVKKRYLSDSSSPTTVRYPHSFRSTTLSVSRCYDSLTTQSPLLSLPPQTLRSPYSFSPTPTFTFPIPFESKTTGNLFPQPTGLSSSRRAKTICSASNDSVPVTDRLISAIAYCIPFLNGLNYGIFLFSQYPILETIFDPIVPLLSFYKSIPGGSMVAFLALFVGVVRDKSFSRYVRFNALQATMLDVLSVLPSLVHILLDSQQEGLKFQILKMGYSATFIGIVVCFLYTFGHSVLGKTPYFRFVTEAIDWQMCAFDRQL